MSKVKLGDEVRDPITGYTGIAYVRCIYLQGCDRIGIQAPVIQEEGKVPEVPELFYVDEPQLVVINPVKKSAKKKITTGGPSEFGNSHQK